MLKGICLFACLAHAASAASLFNNKFPKIFTSISSAEAAMDSVWQTTASSSTALFLGGYTKSQILQTGMPGTARTQIPVIASLALDTTPASLPSPYIYNWLISFTAESVDNVTGLAYLTGATGLDMLAGVAVKSSDLLTNYFFFLDPVTGREKNKMIKYAFPTQLQVTSQTLLFDNSGLLFFAGSTFTTESSGNQRVQYGRVSPLKQFDYYKAPKLSYNFFQENSNIVAPGQISALALDQITGDKFFGGAIFQDSKWQLLIGTWEKNHSDPCESSNGVKFWRINSASSQQFSNDDSQHLQINNLQVQASKTLIGSTARYDKVEEFFMIFQITWGISDTFCSSIITQFWIPSIKGSHPVQTNSGGIKEILLVTLNMTSGVTVSRSLFSSSDLTIYTAFQLASTNFFIAGTTTTPQVTGRKVAVIVTDDTSISCDSNIVTSTTAAVLQSVSSDQSELVTKENETNPTKVDFNLLYIPSDLIQKFQPVAGYCDVTASPTDITTTNTSPSSVTFNAVSNPKNSWPFSATTFSFGTSNQYSDASTAWQIYLPTSPNFVFVDQVNHQLIFDPEMACVPEGTAITFTVKAVLPSSQPIITQSFDFTYTATATTLTAASQAPDITISADGRNKVVAPFTIGGTIPVDQSIMIYTYSKTPSTNIDESLDRKVDEATSVVTWEYKTEFTKYGFTSRTYQITTQARTPCQVAAVATPIAAPDYTLTIIDLCVNDIITANMPQQPDITYDLTTQQIFTYTFSTGVFSHTIASCAVTYSYTLSPTSSAAIVQQADMTSQTLTFQVTNSITGIDQKVTQTIQVTLLAKSGTNSATTFFNLLLVNPKPQALVQTTANITASITQINPTKATPQAASLVNSAPTFTNPQSDVIKIATIGDGYEVQYLINLGSIFDKQGDLVEVYFESSLPNQIHFDLNTNTIVIDQTLMQSAAVGGDSFNVIIRLTDNNISPKTSTYQVQILIGSPEVVDYLESIIEKLTLKADNVTSAINSTDSKPLTLKIVHISQKGVVDVKFSELLRAPINMTAFLNESAIALKVIPSGTMSASNLKFTWNITEFRDDGFQIQINFTNPVYVSSSGIEVLSLQVTNPVFFNSKLHPGAIKNETVVTKDIPPQLKKDEVTNTVTDVVDSVSTVGKVVLISNTVLAIVLSGVLSLVWGTVNTLQIIVYLPLLTVYSPANASYMFAMLGEIASFQLFDPTDFYSLMLKFDETDVAYNEKFDLLGFNSRNIIKNMGIQGIYLMINALAFILLAVLNKVKNKGHPKWQKYSAKAHAKLKSYLMWNGWIRFFLESFLEILISCQIQIFTLKSENDVLLTGRASGDVLSTLLSWLGIGILSMFIILLWVIPLVKKRDTAALKELYEQSHGAFTDQQKVLTKWQIPFNILFITRRAVYALIIFLVNNGAIQSLIMVEMSIGLCIYNITSKPFELNRLNALELFNELTFLLILYCCLLFTDYLSDPETRFTIGWAAILLTLGNFIVNVGVLVFVAIKTLILVVKRHCILKKYHAQKKLATKQKFIAVKVKDQHPSVQVQLKSFRPLPLPQISEVSDENSQSMGRSNKSSISSYVQSSVSIISISSVSDNDILRQDSGAMQARLEQEMRDIIGHSFDNQDKKSINLSELEAEVRQLMYKNNLDEDLIVNPFVRK